MIMVVTSRVLLYQPTYSRFKGKESKTPGLHKDLKK